MSQSDSDKTRDAKTWLQLFLVRQAILGNYGIFVLFLAIITAIVSSFSNVVALWTMAGLLVGYLLTILSLSCASWMIERRFDGRTKKL